MMRVSRPHFSSHSAILLTAVLLPALAGCGEPADAPEPERSAAATPDETGVPAPPPETEATMTDLEGEIWIDGSSTVFPITEVAALAFLRRMPEVEPRIGVSGTGGGFQKFCRGETDVSDASRPIKKVSAHLPSIGRQG